MQKEVSKPFFQSKLIFLLIIGTLSWSLTMIKSGWIYPFGMGFWGPNGHDGVWHIALDESLSKGSFSMPIFAGENLRNYHVGFDLILAILHRITTVPIVNLYFQIVPPILAFLIGLLTYKFVYLWKNSDRYSLLATFFVYFGGSFAWILGKGESAFWAQQALSTLINPPFALSLVIILSGLIFLFKHLKNHATYYFLLSAVSFGVLIQIKAYAGILVLGALFTSGISRLFKDKKFDIVLLFFSSLVLSLAIFLPFNKNPQNLLVFQPFWFLETMMGLTDRVGWLKFYSAMTTYKTGHIWAKAIPAYLIAFGIFWVGNMGTRIIKEVLVLKWIKDFKKISWVEIFVASIIVAGGVIPMFFLQKGTPWNTIQFFYYSLFFSGILAGVSLGKILSRVKSRATYYILLTTVIILTIPTTIITLKDVYLPSRPPAMISNYELSALDFLSKIPDGGYGVVLTYPFDKLRAKEAEVNPPRPLYLYESTAYVSAFSKHHVFLEDQVNLDITGYDWKERRIEIESWYKEKDQAKAREFLKTNGIKYIYWLKGQRALLGESQLGLKKIFENKEVDIYQVQ